MGEKGRITTIGETEIWLLPHPYSYYFNPSLLPGFTEAISGSIKDKVSIGEIDVNNKVGIDIRYLKEGGSYGDELFFTLQCLVNDARTLQQGPDSIDYSLLERQLQTHVMSITQGGLEGINITLQRSASVVGYLGFIKDKFGIEPNHVELIKRSVKVNF